MRQKRKKLIGKYLEKENYINKKYYLYPKEEQRKNL